ncbi:MAG: hypothetical protein NVS2B14_21730 [Chamaesiphon sp.]
MKFTISALLALFALQLPADASFTSHNGWTAINSVENGQSGVMCFANKSKSIFVPGVNEFSLQNLDSQTVSTTITTKKGELSEVTIFPSCDGTWWQRSLKHSATGFKLNQKSLNLPSSIGSSQVIQFLSSSQGHKTTTQHKKKPKH